MRPILYNRKQFACGLTTEKSPGFGGLVYAYVSFNGTLVWRSSEAEPGVDTLSAMDKAEHLCKLLSEDNLPFEQAYLAVFPA